MYDFTSGLLCDSKPVHELLAFHSLTLNRGVLPFKRVFCQR